MPKDSVPNSKKPTNQVELKESKSNHSEGKRKQEDDNGKAKNQEEAITCKSLSEAESKILELFKDSLRFRKLLMIRTKTLIL